MTKQLPALGMIEFKSIAKGVFATDAIAKKAPVKILTTNPVCPGKYIVIFAGDVADIEESLQAGLAAGSDMVINDLFIPNIHHDIIPAIAGTTDIKNYDAIAIVETFSVASCVIGADRAAKETPIKLIEMRLANGLGGKGFFVMTGTLSDIEASTASAKEYISKEGLLAGCEIIPAPHADLIEKGIYW